MIRGAIFDIDGTLLDSMWFWSDTGARYLRSIGITPADNLGNILFYMSLEEGASYIKKEYHLEQSAEEIRAGVLQMIATFYQNEVQLKPGMREVLETLSRIGCPMVLATTSDRELVSAALERLQVMHYFQRLFTATELQTTKKEPLLYKAAASFMGSKPEETLVFEDVLHAVKTAKQAGFLTVVVEDNTSKMHFDEMRTLADYWFC